MTTESFIENFMLVFSEAYKKVGKFPTENAKKEECIEVYWSDYKKETKDFVDNVFNNINRGGMFSLTVAPNTLNDTNKNLKILKLDDNKFYIISNEFRIHTKFNTKSTLDNDDINDLLAIDIMFPFNLEDLNKKWRISKIDII